MFEMSITELDDQQDKPGLISP